MRHSSVKTLLLLTIFVVAIAPLAAAFYFLNRALQTSLDLGFSEPVIQALNVSSQNLKTLKRLDPAEQERYREQFATVSKFSEFARMPAVHLVEEDLPAVITQLFKPIAASFETAGIRLPDVAPTLRLRVRIDVTLFRQVLTNIIRNGVEANPGRSVQFTIQLTASARSIEISISNDGQPVPAGIADRIFDPYVSGKSSKDNMGLGLAIVKKIIFEHGGDVMYREEVGEPVFMISLPRVG